MSDETMRARGTMPVTVLAAEAAGDKGMVEAIVSAYDVRYRMGFATYHTIKPGAFADSITAQDAFPLFWMHAWDWTEQPPIGHGTATEVAAPKPGLKVAGELYLDQPGVMSVFRAMKAGALREWSIGYRILESTRDPDDDLHLLITKAELLEASSVLRGANPETETLKVASFAPTSLQRAADALGAASRELAALVSDASQSTATPAAADQGAGAGATPALPPEEVTAGGSYDPEFEARRVEFLKRQKRLENVGR